MTLLMTALFWVLKILGVWAMLGTALAYAEHALDRWGKMDQATFRRRMIIYGPIAWIMNGFIWICERRAAARAAKAAPAAK